MTKTSARYYAKACYRLAMTHGRFTLDTAKASAQYFPEAHVVQVTPKDGSPMHSLAPRYSWL